MSHTSEWRPLWERRDIDEQARENASLDAQNTRRLRGEAIRDRLPLIAAAIAVVFICIGVMRAILGLFGTAAVPVPASLALCVSDSVGSRAMIDLAAAFLERQGVREVELRQNIPGTQMHLSGRVPGAPAAIAVDIERDDTATVFSHLALRQCTLAFAGREMSPIEVSQFHTPPSASLIALDGVVVVVNPKNPVRVLSLDALRAIFSGELTNWNGITGENMPVHVVLPPRLSDDISLFTNQVLNGQLPVAHYERSVNVADTVSGPRASGNVGLTTFHGSDPARFVRLIDGAGREFSPSTLAIGRRTYPLTLSVYAYREESDTSNAAYKFLTFIDSGDGQNVLVNDGFVSPFLF